MPQPPQSPPHKRRPRPSKAALRAAARVAQGKVRASELRYTLALRGVMRGLHTAVMSTLAPHLADRAKRTDASDGRVGVDVGRILIHYLKQVPGKVVPVFDQMATRLVKDTRTDTLIGITPLDTGVSAQIARARDENIRLVEDAGRAYADDVREVFEDPDNFGLSTDDLRAKLLERGNVSQSRADLIARDQTLKLNGQITRVRQQNAGVQEYDWSGTMDVRERDTHRAQEGQRFRWDSPPTETGHPGQDFQCRCVALPVIPEIEDL